MTRAHFVKSARQDNPVVQKGESYWWWKFPYRGKQYSKERPTRSQLTQSEFFGRVYDIEDDDLGGIEVTTFEELLSTVEGIASGIRELGEEQEEKRQNMPDSLQDAPSGEILQNRYSSCGEWADNLENLDFEEPDRDDLLRTAYSERELEGLSAEAIEIKKQELYDEALQELVDEVQGCCYEGE